MYHSCRVFFEFISYLWLNVIEKWMSLFGWGVTFCVWKLTLWSVTKTFNFTTLTNRMYISQDLYMMWTIQQHFLLQTNQLKSCPDTTFLTMLCMVWHFFHTFCGTNSSCVKTNLRHKIKFNFSFNSQTMTTSKNLDLNLDLDYLNLNSLFWESNVVFFIMRKAALARLY